MKKNTGAQLALYPAPVIVVGAMVDGKPNWTLVAHAGIMAHSHLMLSMVKAHYTNKGIRENKVVSVEEDVLTEKDKIDYRKFKPVLFQFPTYEYLETGDILGACMKMN